MKKTLALVLGILMAMTLLAGCGSKGSSDAPKDSSSQETSESSADTEEDVIASLKTLGDMYALTDTEHLQSSMYNGHFIYVFKLNDVVYRVVAEVSREIEEADYALDFSDPDYHKKEQELLKDVPITRIDNLTEGIPTQEEMDQFVGKTGQELLEDGWYIHGWYADTNEILMNKSPYLYRVIFDGLDVDQDTFEEDDVLTYKVKSITFESIGDAGEIE